MAAVFFSSGIAALISMFMHTGTLPYLIFIYISAFFNGLLFLFSTRTGLASGYHFAWDFCFGIILSIQSSTSLWTIQPQVDISKLEFLAPIGLGVFSGMILIWSSLFAWIRWREHSLALKVELAVPTLFECSRMQSSDLTKM